MRDWWEIRERFLESLMAWNACIQRCSQRFLERWEIIHETFKKKRIHNDSKTFPVREHSIPSKGMFYSQYGNTCKTYGFIYGKQVNLYRKEKCNGSKKYIPTYSSFVFFLYLCTKLFLTSWHWEYETIDQHYIIITDRS